MDGNGPNAYQVLPPDLQHMMAVSSQQPTGTSTPAQFQGATLSTATQLQQLNAQQQQQHLAAVALAAANQQHMLSLGALPPHLAAAAQFGLPTPTPMLSSFPHQANDLLAMTKLFAQNPGHSDVSQLTLPNLDHLKQSVKPETVSRSIQRSRSETGASSAYASRHQAAEQRRRTRINERYGSVVLCTPLVACTPVHTPPPPPQA